MSCDLKWHSTSCVRFPSRLPGEAGWKNLPRVMRFGPEIGGETKPARMRLYGWIIKSTLSHSSITAKSLQYLGAFPWGEQLGSVRGVVRQPTDWKPNLMSELATEAISGERRRVVMDNSMSIWHLGTQWWLMTMNCLTGCMWSGTAKSLVCDIAAQNHMAQKHLLMTHGVGKRSWLFLVLPGMTRTRHRIKVACWNGRNSISKRSVVSCDVTALLLAH